MASTSILGTCLWHSTRRWHKGLTWLLALNFLLPSLRRWHQLPFWVHFPCRVGHDPIPIRDLTWLVLFFFLWRFHLWVCKASLTHIQWVACCRTHYISLATVLPSALRLDIPPSNTSLSSNLCREWDPLAASLPSVVDEFRTPSMTAKVKLCEQG